MFHSIILLDHYSHFLKWVGKVIFSYLLDKNETQNDDDVGCPVQESKLVTEMSFKFWFLLPNVICFSL